MSSSVPVPVPVLGSRRLFRPSSASHRGVVLLCAFVLVLTSLGTSLLAPARVARAATATTTAALNLRAGPSTATQVLAVMPAGSSVWISGGSQNGFYPVTYGSMNGWAYGAYLRQDGGNTNPGPGTGTGTARTTAALNLRAGPSLADRVIAVMPAGATVTLTGNSANGFVSVSYNGTRGWAYGAYLTSGGTPSPTPTPSPPPAGSGTAVTTDYLNLRSGPSTAYWAITVMPPGATVQLTGIGQNGFYYVVYSGMEGWAAADYLRTGGAPPPPTPTPTPNPGSGSTYGPGGGPYTEQQIIEIIYQAADRYGQPRADMLRVARCESLLDPNAVNPAGSYGLFQFIPSTWASTPFRDYSIFDAWASANAAGWMWSVGRRNEWVCQ